MSPALNRSSAIQRFNTAMQSESVTIIFDFYMGLPHLYSILDCHNMCGSPEQKPNVTVSHLVYLHHHAKSDVLLIWTCIEGGAIHTLHRSIRYSCIHRSGTGPALNRSLAIQCFECGGVNKITDGVLSISICDCHMYVFHQLTGANKFLLLTSSILVADLLLGVLVICKLIPIACWWVVAHVIAGMWQRACVSKVKHMVP